MCTWTMISGCTEEGRKFAEYGACEPVLTQRPYTPVPPFAPPVEPDTRLEDPVYAAEQAWVTAQVEACACVCCHQTSVTPAGASVWDIEAPGNLINSFSPYGLAFAGDFIDSYEPGLCTADEGITADGEIRWSGGWARYVYVLAADADNPGVPPNLDLPTGTQWRLDALADGPPFKSGAVQYGELAADTRQGFPAMGAPAALKAGQRYYLYVLADIGVPITRCLFAAP